jgi:patatin-like phospholipase/acyl hydrolase
LARFRILSIDGGGVRGIVPVIVLERLNRRFPGWLDAADLIAGTSTGGLLALALAHGLELREIREFYSEKGPQVFADTWIDNLRDIGTFLGARYDSASLVRALKTVFGNATLGDLKKRVLVASFDLDNRSKDPRKRTWKPKLFHNYPGRDSDRRERAYRVGAYTCAAPTYFASVDGFIDGGVYANNPSMCALAQSQDKRAVRPAPRLRDVVLLSLGTGTPLKFIRGRSLDWGYLKWAGPIIDIMMEGVSGIADFQCAKILGGNYHRLAPVLGSGKEIRMDAHEKIPELVSFAESVDIRSTTRWLKRRWLE